MKFWLTLENGVRAARENSMNYGGAWVVWKDWSWNEQIRVTRQEEFENESTLADQTLAVYENGEEQ